MPTAMAWHAHHHGRPPFGLVIAEDGYWRQVMALKPSAIAAHLALVDSLPIDFRKRKIDCPGALPLAKTARKSRAVERVEDLLAINGSSRHRTGKQHRRFEQRAIPPALGSSCHAFASLAQYWIAAPRLTHDPFHAETAPGAVGATRPGPPLIAGQ